MRGGDEQPEGGVVSRESGGTSRGLEQMGRR